MTEWTSDELTTIANEEELDLSSRRGDGSLREPTPMWVVREGNDVYVRSINGPDGVWFRRAKASHVGHVRVGGIDKDVAFVVDPDPALNDRIDADYRTKYGRYGAKYVASVVNPTSRKSTMRLVPR